MIEIRECRDVEELMAWRGEVILNVFGVIASPALMAANREYYRQYVADGTHLGFVASCDGEDVGCGAICLSDELPSPDNPSGRCAYLMNIYVRERYRHHGIAGSLVNHLVDEAKRLGCGKIYLESTDAAKHLYRSCGFNDMENMMKYED
ncbi:MAG: GNAT family N-acetyltransferase [Pseudoflavonifractor sp.]|nr:GNAT family N-acetyltransferase [Pseudoflavonifractor sp.]